MERRSGHFQDVRDLAAFITTVWGVLAAFSIVLPVINSWITFIPVPPTTESIATAVATIAAAFAFLYAYVEGEEEGAFADDPTGYRRRAPTPAAPSLRSAFGRFAWAVLALAFFLAMMTFYAFVRGTSESTTGLMSGILVPILLVTYAALFGFLTAALTSLAMVHRLSAQRNRVQPIMRPLPRDEMAPGYFQSPDDEDTTRLAPELQADGTGWRPGYHPSPIVTSQPTSRHPE